MQPTPGYKPKECIRKGLPTFIVPEKPKVREIIQRDIMNPMVKIEHHVSSPSLMLIFLPLLRAKKKRRSTQYDISLVLSRRIARQPPAMLTA